MGTEHELKFLLRENGISYTTLLMQEVIRNYDLEATISKAGVPIRQGYVSSDVGRALIDETGIVPFSFAEARLRKKGDKYFFTVKGDGTASRAEEERIISAELFEDYWPKTAGKRVEKMRMTLPFFGVDIELDLYTDRSLIVAEIEVPSEEMLASIRPLGKDVTADKAYKNKNLAQ